MNHSLDSQLARIQHFQQVRIQPPVTQWYGLEKCLRAFLAIPKPIPLNIFPHHGAEISDWQNPKVCDIVKQPLFVTRQGHADSLLSGTGLNSHVMGSPFVHYRRLTGIEPLRPGEYLLVFPVHSGQSLDNEFDWDLYARQLTELPAEFHPIKVCAYWLDIVRGRHEHFRRHGLEVVCAGHMFDPDFVDNFYSLLRGARYTTSNDVGSPHFYSVEMGIPFFYFGEGPRYIALTLQAENKTKNTLFHAAENLQKLIAFATFPDLSSIQISPEHRAFIDHFLGMTPAVNVSELRRVVLREALRNPLGDHRLMAAKMRLKALLTRYRRGLGSILPQKPN